MDPNETYDLMISDFSAGYIGSAIEHAQDLADWVTSGGFAPRRANWQATLSAILQRGEERAARRTLAGSFAGFGSDADRAYSSQAR
jgi:hypothetical protein